MEYLNEERKAVVLKAEDGKQEDSRNKSYERVTAGVHGDGPRRFLTRLLSCRPCASEKLDPRNERYNQIRELLIAVAFHGLSSPLYTTAAKEPATAFSP
jgi:hypothetical protein